jgi:hypothetical protein
MNQVSEKLYFGQWVYAGFVNYKKGCTRLTATSDKVDQLLAHGRWFSSGTPTSSTKTGRHDIDKILLKMALNTINHGRESICCFSAKHAALKIKNKDWSARNQNNVSEWSDISTHGLLFQ